MTTLKFKTGVRYDGIRYEKNQVESGFSDKEVELFVGEDVAFVVGVPTPPNEEGDQGLDPVNDPPPPNETEDPAEIYKELDENWTLDELKTDAERIGVEFKKDTLKKDLIKIIIENGHADEFLAMIDDEDEE